MTQRDSAISVSESSLAIIRVIKFILHFDKLLCDLTKPLDSLIQALNIHKGRQYVS